METTGSKTTTTTTAANDGGDSDQQQQPRLEEFAVKIISKQSLSNDDREYIRTEVAILKHVNHKYIVRMVDIFDDKLSP